MLRLVGHLHHLSSFILQPTLFKYLWCIVKQCPTCLWSLQTFFPFPDLPLLSSSHQSDEDPSDPFFPHPLSPSTSPLPLSGEEDEEEEDEERENPRFAKPKDVPPPPPLPPPRPKWQVCFPLSAPQLFLLWMWLDGFCCWLTTICGSIIYLFYLDYLVFSLQISTREMCNTCLTTINPFSPVSSCSSSLFPVFSLPSTFAYWRIPVLWLSKPLSSIPPNLPSLRAPAVALLPPRALRAR